MYKILIFCLPFLFGFNYSSHLQRVFIIDTGLEVKDERFQTHICGYKDFTGEGIADKNGHGTHVAGLIQQFAGNSNYCLVILKYFSDKANNKSNSDNFVLAIKEAINQKADIINVSGGGPMFDPEEYDVIKKHQNITIITAAGNEGQNLDEPNNAFYPASYNLSNIIVVGAIDKNNKRLKFSNYGATVNTWELGESLYSTLPNGKYGMMTGTSMATAVFTGKTIKLREENESY